MYLGIDTSIRVGCGGHRMLAVRNGRREAGVVVEKGYFFPMGTSLLQSTTTRYSINEKDNKPC
jgi:hypothetical protein